MAFRGVDLRDLYRGGSNLTPRRLLVLVRALPHDAMVWLQMQQAADKAEADRLATKHEEAKAYYKNRAKEVTA